MKYDLLREYREYLGARFRPATVQNYCIRLEQLLEGQSVLHTEETFNVSSVIDKLSEIKYKNYFSQYKNALFHFLEFQHLALNQEDSQRIEELEMKTKKKRRGLKYVDINAVIKRINRIRNSKLKLSYQTMLYTGLRVSELSQIIPNNTLLSNNGIQFSFIGKGGKKETVKLLKTDNLQLFQALKEQIEKTNPDKKVFYAVNYLQGHAKELGFQCHDLRRAYAKTEYKKSKSKEAVQKKLRHSSKMTTNIYLKSKVIIK